MRLTRAEIDLRALRHNVNAVRGHIPEKVKIMGLVKANAYGHGIVRIARELVACGVDYLGVGFLEEGIVLRQSGISCPILVLGGVLGSGSEFLRHDLEITVASVEIARRMDEEAGRPGGEKARVHLKVDTGMERIGVRAENALPFIKQAVGLKNLEVIGLYSHFATSDEKDKTFALDQLRRFTLLLDRIRAEKIEIPLVHMANSGAILDLPQSCFSMVRPGIILYGIYPSRQPSGAIPLQPVASLHSAVVYTKEVEAGTSISYGRRYVTPRRTRIATIPIGYGDGYNRLLTNSGEALIGGRRYPVAGTVCMDQTMLDLGPDSEVRVGDEVVLLGRDGAESISAWDIAEKIGTIPYEVFTGITDRVPRVYVD